MGPRPRMIDRLRAIRSDWRLWLEPRPVAVVVALVAMLLMAFGSGLFGSARDGLPGQSVRALRGTVAQAREVFSGAGDDKATTEVVTAADPTTTSDGHDPAPGGQEPLRQSDPVATLGDDDEPLTVAEVRRLLEREPDRARDLVFLPGVSVGEATVILDRAPTPAQMPTRPPQSSSTSSTSSTTTTTRPRPPGSSSPTPSPTRPPATAPPTTAPPTTVGTTAPPETVPDTTVPPETVPDTTVPPETVPDTTAPPETVPDTTVPPETVPDTTVPPIELPPIELPDLGL